ncbi:hypothetical protein SeMB42_g01475 [Synchytrium endobioticum]|uniref:Uncharacterized protein n=1 Tax=Synchytrium endobioticum TaxID=286115 RepID=A0A507DNA7_9FUNG|nr:hypothetical protein SeLEV6574_g01198 [Synchytrium endobioticum]TPX52358.1 hypothetical protein SeMB42_g01475 [Synchytrium endobioticum]
MAQKKCAPKVDSLSVEQHGIIGNMRTAALVSNDGSIDFLCLPRFDSPSIFARLLDIDKGGHFSINPILPDEHHDQNGVYQRPLTRKQQYQLATNILQTRFLFDFGVLQVTDFMHKHDSRRHPTKALLPWVIRIVECQRGTMKVGVNCLPAFNYATEKHTVELADMDILGANVEIDEWSHDKPRMAHGKAYSESKHARIIFKSERGFSVDLRSISHPDNPIDGPDWKLLDGELGPMAQTQFDMQEGQSIAFIFRQVPAQGANAPVKTNTTTTSEVARQEANNQSSNSKNSGDNALWDVDPLLSWPLVLALRVQTFEYWTNWIRKSNYYGRYREVVQRSALTLKLLTYEPTGAIVAAPTFGLPEEIRGVRNWDYRYVWIRDSAFTIYAFIRIGLTDEAGSYMKWIEDRLENANPDGSLNVMYTVDGQAVPSETILHHLAGNRNSQPVRIGNAAATHLQLDIYGALLDAVYLYNKYREPIGYDTWRAVRRIVNYIVDHHDQADMSIWEIRSRPQNFLYSKVMCWVGLDRGLRLMEKRSLPCPDRVRWYETRDKIYEEIMTKGWNSKMGAFTQSYEGRDVGILDASVLIMPMVFFCSPTDRRILSTIDNIMRPPEKGGLTLNGLVLRYNLSDTQDGLPGTEGCFLMCTFWLIEALTRAGKHNSALLQTALSLFEQTVSFGNSLSLFSEEITKTGDMLGNFPQAFTHLALISAVYNLDKQL